MKVGNIKFKAKRLDNGEWVKGDLAHFLDGGLNILGFTRENGVDYYSGVHLINPTTVCQFTGEKDMNGKEIYTGDIISNIETGSVIEVAWNDRLKRLDCKFLNIDTGLKVPFGIFVSRYKRIVVLRSKFDKEE